MFFRTLRAWWRLPALALLACAAGAANAHVHWTRTNSVDADTIALYHFDSATSTAAPVAASLPAGLGLSVFSGAAQLAPLADTAGAIFQPQSLSLPSAQVLRTTDTVAGLAGDLTIECWFQWLPALTSCSLEVGLRSGARIVVARDVANPANDRFGIAGTHGSFIPAPGFTSWAALGDEEASLGEWRHLALAIHSTGIHYDPVEAHDVYSTGSVARLYLNGHATGTFPFAIDVAGLKVHDASQVTVMVTSGGMALDELALWRRDWTANGAAANPFADGRGGAGVAGWILYDDTER